jgi:hypothetical protein
MTDLSLLLEQFPNFDYRNPKEPWRMDARHPQSLADLQIQAFHYFWTLEATKKGNIGLSLVTPHLPFCFTLSHANETGIHRRDAHMSMAWVFEPSSFACVVASAVLPEIFCDQVPIGAEKKIRKKARCQGKEVITHLHTWSRFLAPSGLLLGVLFDNDAAQDYRHTNVIDELDVQHAWSAASFYQHVLRPFVQSHPFVIEEYDTLKNNLAFNFVIRRSD